MVRVSPIESPLATALIVAAALGFVLWLAAAVIARAEHRHDPGEVGFCERCHRYVPRSGLAMVETVRGVHAVCTNCATRAMR